MGRDVGAHRRGRAVSLLLLLWACRPVAPGPDVVVVIVDSLRADAVSPYGGPVPTPAVQRLADQGVVFEHALSQAPWTLPSIASLLTSRWPDDLGITDIDTRVPDDAVLASEVLYAAGYDTGLVVSHRLVGAGWGFDQGFRYVDESWVRGHEAITSAGVTDVALDLLARRGRRPLFLVVHYFDPHHTYRRHADLDPGPAHADWPEGQTMEQLLARLPRMSELDLERVRGDYLSEVRYTDQELGRLLDGLDALPAPPLVVFTADHGDEFADHGSLGHTRTLYDELVHVPLVVRYPDGHTGREARPVALVDVVPTVLEVAGVPAPDGLRGVSLLRDPGPRVLLTGTSRQADLRAAVAGDLKLVHDRAAGTDTLYDRAVDPLEQRDATVDHPDEAAALRALLEGVGAAPSVARPLGEDEARMLQELGYRL